MNRNTTSCLEFDTRQTLRTISLSFHMRDTRIYA